MTRFAASYLDPGAPLQILDVGSLDINGCLREIFNQSPWQYTGLDIQSGPNVDIVLSDPYKFPMEKESFDVVVSVSAMEHVEDIYAWSEELIRILKPNGLICLTAPFSWAFHQYPLDCWRFAPDGMRFLFIKRGGLTEIEIKLVGFQGDVCLLIARK